MMAIDRPRKGETAAEFFRRRSQGSTLDGLDRILAKVPDRPPEPGDDSPEGWTPDRPRANGLCVLLSSAPAKVPPRPAFPRRFPTRPNGRSWAGTILARTRAAGTARHANRSREAKTASERK